MKLDSPISLRLERSAAEAFAIDANTVCVAGPISDYTEHLTDLDRTRSASWVEQRRWEFSTGRRFARAGLSLLGTGDEPELGLIGRRPLWPSGYVGSISHSGLLAIVIVSNNPQLEGLGIDIEPASPTPEATDRMVLTPAERGRLAATGRLFATQVFSAKEAVYKAVNPISGSMIGFQDVELKFDAAATRFSAHYTGSSEANRIMQRGNGFSSIYRDHIISSFFISSGCNDRVR
jgi:4'-phosphopantetheinyl transferase EntD